MSKLEAMADEVMGAMRGYIARNLDSLVQRLTAVESRQPEKGEPGKDADPAMIRAEVEKQVAGIPRLPGLEGEPGRDALQIEILPTIDLNRSYSRRTYAQWKGGVIMSTRTTDSIKDERIDLAGWAHVVRGIDSFVIEQTNERNFACVAKMSDGTTDRSDFHIPAMIQRGIWKEGEYERGDVTTRDGSQWHCNVEKTTESPGGSPHWTLIVKRGAAGKDADAKPVPRQPVRIQ